jgi:hypothetical protein
VSVPGFPEIAGRPIDVINWTPPGPVAAAFEASEAPNPIIIGPVGSGKTTTAMRKAMRIAQAVPTQILSLHGVRQPVKSCRGAIVASTHRILWKNLIPSYWKVFPRDWGSWTGGEGEPAVHRFGMRLLDPASRAVVTFDMQIDFMGIGDRDLDEVTRGLELTWGYVYEFDTQPEGLVSKLLSRCGRWPNMPTGAEQDLVPRQVWCDANAFDPDSWAYAHCFSEKALGTAVFVQPPGTAANAENVQNVGRRYYDDLKLTLRPWEFARLVENRFVPDRPGFVVFPDWSPLVHAAASPLAVDKGLPLLVGVDPGLKAAAVVCQRVRPHVWRVLAELVTPADRVAVAEQFGRELADLLAQRFPGLPALVILDPAANAQSAVAGVSWAQAFLGACRYPARMARTNKVRGPDGRLNALRHCLTTLSGGEPGLLVDPSCKTLLKGMNGGYRWRPVPNKPALASTDIDKTQESHVCEALQYPVDTIEGAPALMADAAGGAGGPRGDPPTFVQVF